MAFPEWSRNTSFAWAVGIGLLLATVCNGAGFYLKRVGLINADAYRAYWAVHCSTLHALSLTQAAGPECCTLATPAERAQPGTVWSDGRHRAQTRYLYSTPGAELALKLVKDGFGLALLALSLFMLTKRAAPFSTARRAWPVELFLAYVGVAFLVSLALHGPLTAGAGLRLFMFLGLAVLGQWLVPHRAFIAACAGVLLIFELCLMPLEILRGVHLHGHFYSLPFAGRASGTLVLPNTLGVFSASALAFYYSFAPNRLWLPTLGLTTLALILFSGSATGLVCIGLILYVATFERVAPDKRRLFIVAATIAFVALVAALPSLIGRPYVFDSLFGSGERLDGIRMALTNRGILETIFGSGLGVNTNTAANMVSEAGTASVPGWTNVHLRPTDSTLTGLLIQVGVLGTLLFYGALGWAAVSDLQARMFYLVVITCSLSLNIAEVFPVNFLLGVALAHSVAVAGSNRSCCRS